MIGIQREWLKEEIEKYRELFPDDTRDDNTIGEAIQMMREPRVRTMHTRRWEFMQINEDQLTLEDLCKFRAAPEEFLGQYKNYRNRLTKKIKKR